MQKEAGSGGPCQEKPRVPSSDRGAVGLVEKAGTGLPQESAVWSPSAKGARGAAPQTCHLLREKSTRSRLKCTLPVKKYTNRCLVCVRLSLSSWVTASSGPGFCLRASPRPPCGWNAGACEATGQLWSDPGPCYTAIFFLRSLGTFVWECMPPASLSLP